MSVIVVTVEHTDAMPTDADTQPSEIEKIVRSYMASFAAGDADTIAAHVAPGFVNEHTAALGSGCVGADTYRDRLPGFLSDMAGLAYTVEHVVVSGTMAAVFYSMTAHWQNTTPIEVRGAQRIEVVDGLITHRVDYWDSKVFLDQLAAAEGA